MKKRYRSALTGSKCKGINGHITVVLSRPTVVHITFFLNKKRNQNFKPSFFPFCSIAKMKYSVLYTVCRANTSHAGEAAMVWRQQTTS